MSYLNHRVVSGVIKSVKGDGFERQTLPQYHPLITTQFWLTLQLFFSKFFGHFGDSKILIAKIQLN